MGVDGQRHAPAAELYRRLGGPQVSYGQVRENLATPGFKPRTVKWHLI